ncbi:cyclic nucleotide-gated ion channel 1 [Rosa chinensis]|uniref:cyclic nucleotide-gated ion channel 1 n=1 Tax=Rosa chinensis TaxID=74649 RepID=UPI000D08A42B|nr:cyclic nucleotide-gated ion channel 1 [Rosa chinensis]
MPPSNTEVMSNPDRCFGISINSSNRQVRQRNTSSTSSPSPTRESDEESLKPKSEESTMLRSWKITVVVSCVIAVLADPLFLYIPLINDKSKCLGMDKKLRIVALLLRSLTDIVFIIDIIRQVRERNTMMAKVTSLSSSCTSTPKNIEELAKEETRKKRQFYVSIIIHLLAVLPIPQVSVLVVFFRMRDSGYLPKIKVLNVILLLQYVPNILRLRQSYKRLQLTEKLVRGVFNFFLYVVASHVVGAFWYFFSIERETSCWLQACKNIVGCIVTHCGDSTPTNDAFLDRSCPINPSNATLFDFGMFLDTIQSGYTRQMSFPKKFFYSFWWGLKNLRHICNFQNQKRWTRRS